MDHYTGVTPQVPNVRRRATCERDGPDLIVIGEPRQMSHDVQYREVAVTVAAATRSPSARAGSSARASTFCTNRPAFHPGSNVKGVEDLAVLIDERPEGEGSIRLGHKFMTSLRAS